MIGNNHEMDLISLLEALKDTTESQSGMSIILTKETVVIASTKMESCVSSFGLYAHE